MKVPLGVFSMQLWTDAQAYLRVAEILVHDNSSGIDAPTYFLLSHGLELTLKAYLVARGDVGNAELRDLSHDIERVHKKAVALGLQLKNKHAVPLIRILSDFHKDFVFRYPVINDDGSLVVRGTLVRAIDALATIEDICKQIHGTVLSARLEAAKEGEYPIETWHMG
jgi:hypothetical protein